MRFLTTAATFWLVVTHFSPLPSTSWWLREHEPCCSNLSLDSISAKNITVGTMNAERLFEGEWYILARYYEDNKRIPRILGPFPSRELCRLAGEDTFPDDPRFWTSQHIVEHNAKLAKDRAERESQIAEKLKTAKRDKNGRVWVTLDSGSQILIDKDGKEVGWSGPLSAFAGSMPPDAITGCVTREGAEKEAFKELEREK